MGLENYLLLSAFFACYDGIQKPKRYKTVEILTLQRSRAAVPVLLWFAGAH